MNGGKKIKSLILIPVLLGVLALTLTLVKQRQETRRGAAGTLGSATLMFDKTDVEVKKGGDFDVSLVLGVKARISGSTWVLCHSPKLSITKEDIIPIKGGNEETPFSIYHSNLDDRDGQKCFSLTLLVEKPSDYLIGSNEDTQVISLFKMNFLANETGEAEIKLMSNDSDLVGENTESDNKRIQLVADSLSPVSVKITSDSGDPGDSNFCNLCLDKTIEGTDSKKYGDANCDGEITNLDLSIFFTEKYDIEDEDHNWEADFNCSDEISRPDNLDYAVWVNSCYEEDRCPSF
jgi:hypothetical protein